MKKCSSESGEEKHPCRQGLILSLLTFTMLVSLWQRLRVGRSQRETQRPTGRTLRGIAPIVSIIVPMRNEAAHVDACLASLCAQNYPDLEILIIDDGSSDETPQLLADWSRRDARVRVHRIEQLPAGWSGKTYAMHTGVLLTRGEWVLFTDADTRHHPEALRTMLGHALACKVDFLSLLPNIMTLRGPAMPLLWPITAIILAQRVTPAEIQDPATTQAFGFGQYILLRRTTYLATGGYDVPGMRTSAVDDIALATYIKRAGGCIKVVNGRGLITNVQWTTWQSARQGWVKSCYSEIIRANLPLLTLPGALALIAYGALPTGWLFHAWHTGKVRRLSTLLAAITVLMQIETKRCVDRDYKLAPTWALAASPGWIICGLMMLDVTRLLLSGKRATWKGRLIPMQEQFTHLTRQQHTSLSSPQQPGAEQTQEGSTSPGGDESRGEEERERA